MADADNKETSSEQAENTANQGNSKVESELASVRAMLEQMNQSFAAAAAANQTQKKTTQVEEDIDPVYDSKRFRQAVRDDAKSIAADLVKQERELNTVVYQMSQEYPELASDQALKSMVIEAQRNLPDAIRETAVGYETAILKAIHKKGLLPKSKRQAQLDEDVSMGSSRSTDSGSRRQSKAKVSEETLAVAELLGRDINDPNVLKRLEEASKRTRWGKYE